MSNIVDELKKADESYDSGDFSKAVEIYFSLYKKNKINNPFQFARFADSLRKNNQPLEFIDIYKKIDDNTIKTHPRIKSALCWCYYDGVIKNYNIDDINGFERFIKTANYIINNCEQKKSNEFMYNPFVLTVFRVAKLYKEKGRFLLVLEWLEKINPTILPTKCYKYHCAALGKEVEEASYLEKYYQYKVVSLEKVEKYPECIKCCEEAFEKIEKFHYRNGKWFNIRKLYAECIVNKGDKIYLNKYKNLALREKEWFMFAKLSDLYYRYNDVDNALLYAFKAVLNCREPEKLVNVFFNIGLLLKNKNDVNNKIFFSVCAHYKYINSWKFSEELECEIAIQKIDYRHNIEFSNIKNISKMYLEKKKEKVLEYEGIITKVFLDREYGFIHMKDNESIYFKFSSVKFNLNDISENDKVIFNLKKYEDKKMVAFNIRRVEDGSSYK